MSTHYRPLAPRPDGTSLDPPSSPNNNNTTNNSGRRTTVSAACDCCRSRKIKCDGKRPTCSKCASSKRTCVYATQPSETRASAFKRKHGDNEHRLRELEESYSNLEQLVDAVRTRGDQDASAIYRSLRRGDDVPSILRHLQAGDLLVQLQVMPETRFRENFPYRNEMPQSLLTSDNPYLRAAIFEATGNQQNLQQQQSSAHSGAASELQRQFKPQYLTPYVAAKIMEPRIELARLSKWTTVSNDDQLMRKLLYLYLLNEYHWLSCFQKDLFLDDMVSGQTRFCSSLLVNAVLAHACNCNRDFMDRLEYWNPHSLGYKFFAEAKRLWELELGKDSITTIQAGMVINIILNMHAMDKLGASYGEQAVMMAYKMGLFDRTNRITATRDRRAYEYTAWALYFWMSLSSYHFLKAPMIQNSPRCPLPDPHEDVEWYGDFWLQYPLTTIMCPTNHPQLFKAKCHLMIIMHRIATDLFGREEQPSNSAYMITNHLSAIQNWFATLPKPLSPVEIMFPFQLKLHLLGHNVVINLCELLVAPDFSNATPLMASHARTCLAHSKVCFETLIRLYYLRHGFKGADTYITHDLAVLAFMVIGQLGETLHPSFNRDELRSSLILAAKGLSDQGQNYYTPFTIFHLIRSNMGQEDLDALDQHVTAWGGDSASNDVRAAHVKAQYPVNIVRMTDYSDSNRLGNMIRQYSDMALDENLASPEATG